MDNDMNKASIVTGLTGQSSGNISVYENHSESVSTEVRYRLLTY